MADSRIWDSGQNLSPAATFNLAGMSGPEYSGSYFGTRLGYLISEASWLHRGDDLQLTKSDGSRGRTTGNCAAVTVVRLPRRRDKRIRTTDGNLVGKEPQLIPVDPIRNLYLALGAIAPSFVSVSACVLCLVSGDRICATLILLGIFSSGFSSIVLGAGKLWIRVPVPSPASPPGDGLMFPVDGSIIVLKGEEADVNIVTKGEFELNYSGIFAHKKHHSIGFSSLLLMTQFLVQLLFIPRSHFFGQIMFLASFVASGAYHLYVVSHEREKVHQDILCRDLAIRMEKRKLGTRTQMAVFVCLLLGNGRLNPSASNPDAILSHILPKNKPVWDYWRNKVVKELDNFWKCDLKSSSLYTPRIQAEPENQKEEEEHSKFLDGDRNLLQDLIDDAWCVFNRYPKWRCETRIWMDDNEEKDRSLQQGESQV